MPNENILLADCTWREIERLAERGTILVVPVGSLEQHGHHLPVSTDVNSVTALSKALPRDDLVVAPPVCFGYTRTMQTYPGTLTLSAETFLRLMRELLSEYARLGFGKILVLNGHYENFPLLVEAAELAVGQPSGSASGTRIVSVNWWDVLPSGLVDELFGDASPAWAASHAGVVETSLALFAEPHRVRTDRLSDGPPFAPLPYAVSPQRRSDIAPDGVSARLSVSSPEAGARLHSATIAGLQQLIEREFC